MSVSLSIFSTVTSSYWSAKVFSLSYLFFISISFPYFFNLSFIIVFASNYKSSLLVDSPYLSPIVSFFGAQKPIFYFLVYIITKAIVAAATTKRAITIPATFPGSDLDSSSIGGSAAGDSSTATSVAESSDPSDSDSSSPSSTSSSSSKISSSSSDSTGSSSSTGVASLSSSLRASSLATMDSSTDRSSSLSII